MRKWILIIVAIALLVAIAIVIISPRQLLYELTGDKAGKQTESNLSLQTQVIAERLDTPWSLVFLPDGAILVTERPGSIRMIDPAGKLLDEPIARLDNVEEIGEGGLLGICLHPQFTENNFIYLYYTYSATSENTFNRVSRFTLTNHSLSDEQIIVNSIPGARNHNGGRIAFGPDGYLYITTGDAAEPSLAQDTASLAGKILRVTDSGQPAPGNPFNSVVYSYGHRNPQGLAWDDNDQLWSTEHGNNTTDELNRITVGSNYGWPTIQGDQSQNGMQSPVMHSGSATWAPSGLAYWQNRLFFAGLRGQALYEFSGANSQLASHFSGQFGRLREAKVGPDGYLYLLTSNRDGRGVPDSQDDRLIRVQSR